MKSEDVAQTVDDLWRFSTEQLRSIARLRVVGYGLIVLAIFDFIDSFIPPQFTNPGWELQTIGALVERAPVPLLATALIFFGENFERSKLGALVTRMLSWFCLVLAVVFLLMAPLGAVNTMRINNRASTEISNQVKQRMDQLKQVEDQVKKGTPADIRTLADQLANLGLNVSNQDPEQLRKTILDRISPAKDALQKQEKEATSGQRLILFKNATKWILGALISSFLYFSLWKGSRWARR